MKFSCIKLNRKEGKEDVMYVNNGCVIATVSIQTSSLTMEETLLDKGILKKLTKERKSLAFYTTVNKAKTLNKS